MSPQHRYHSYKSRALSALLATQAAPKHYVGNLAEKRRLNIFEEKMKMETAKQITPLVYALTIIYEETGKAMEYFRLT